MDWRNIDKYPTTWKWVLLVFLVLLVIQVVSPKDDGAINLEILVSLLNITAIYGLGYVKPIIGRAFWRAYFWIYSIPVLLVVAYSSASLGRVDSLGIVIGFLLGCFFLAVEVRALFLYAYRRNDIWRMPKE